VLNDVAGNFEEAPFSFQGDYSICRPKHNQPGTPGVSAVIGMQLRYGFELLPLERS
jgi:hypothetical protein